MHAYKELSRAIGEEKHQVQLMETEGTEPSRAGKMKSRRRSKGGEPKFLQVMAGHKEFLSKHNVLLAVATSLIDTSSLLAQQDRQTNFREL